MSDESPPPNDVPPDTPADLPPPPAGPPRAPAYPAGSEFPGAVPPSYGGGPYDPYGPGGFGYPYAAWPAPAPRDGLGTAALVLGITGAVAAVSCFGAVLGLPLGALALVFGIAGRRRAGRAEATNAGQALAGAILGAVAIVVSVAMIVLLVLTFRDGLPTGPRVLLTSVRGARSLPLGPDGTATFRDGTWVTVSAARRFVPPAGADGYTAGDAAYRFTVTVRDTGDGALDLGDYSYSAMAGGGRKDLRLVSTDSGPLSEDFPGTLRSGDSVTVFFAFDVPGGLGPLEFGFQPTARHQDAFWRLAAG